MSYKFVDGKEKLSAERIWEFIKNGLSRDVTIKSIKDKIPYEVNSVSNQEIVFSAATRNSGEPEIIRYLDFATVISKLKKETYFNTSSSKELFKGTRLYRKRSPFFSLLLSCGVIEKV